MSDVSTRLVRLLNMVPYLQANPRITCDEAAAALGVTEKQLRADLNQLWLCGLPGLRPRRSHRLRLRGRHGRSHVRRGNGPSVAADLAGGDGHPGGTAGAAGRAGHGRSGGRAKRDREDRVGGRRSERFGRRRRSQARSRVKPLRCGRPSRRPGLDDRLLLGVARHAVQSDRRPDSRRPRRRPHLPRGVVPVGGRRQVVPVRPHRRRAGARRAVTAARARRCRPAPTPRCSTPTPRYRRRRLLVDRSAAWMFDYYPLRVVRELPDGACEAAMTYASDDWMARFVLGFGSACAGAGTAVARRSGSRIRCAALAAYEAQWRVDSGTTSGGDPNWVVYNLGTG